jgi:hypothetical protein
MLVHPSIHHELAHLRQQEALARAEHDRLVHASLHTPLERQRLAARVAARMFSALRGGTSGLAHRRGLTGEADA